MFGAQSDLFSSHVRIAHCTFMPFLGQWEKKKRMNCIKPPGACECVCVCDCYLLHCILDTLESMSMWIWVCGWRTPNETWHLFER